MGEHFTGLEIPLHVSAITDLIRDEMEFQPGCAAVRMKLS